MDEQDWVENPYESLWDETPEEAQPDPQDLRWGLAVPNGWKNR